MLLNAAKCQGYSFYPVPVIKGKPTVLGLIVLMKNWLKPLLDDKLLNNFTEWEISLCKLRIFSEKSRIEITPYLNGTSHLFV